MSQREDVILAIKTMTDNWPAFIDDLENAFDVEYSAGYEEGYHEGYADARYEDR